MISVDPSIDVTPGLIRLTRIAGRFSDFRPLLGGRVDVLARGLIRKQFLTQGRAFGKGWKKLRPTYLARRVLSWMPILRQSEGLFEALTRARHPSQKVTLEPDLYSLTIDESADEHARFIGHQLGIPVSNVPARPMVPTGEPPKTFIDDVRRAVKAYVVR